MQVKKNGNKMYQELETNIKEDFCFLFVGMWLKGAHTCDRKNVGGLVETFLTTFATKENKPALLLKTSMGNNAEKYRHEILERIDSIKNKVVGELNVDKLKLPNVYLLHGILTDSEINDLYNHPKIKAMVSFTRGEGYGRPFAEWSAATNKPLIVSNWSGHVDFCDPAGTILLNGKLEQIHKTAVWDNILIPESSWFTVDYKQSMIVLDKVFTNYELFQRKAKTQHKNIINNFNLLEMYNRLKIIIDRNYVNRKKDPIFVPLKNV